MQTRYSESVQHTELLAGIITANLVNVSMGAPEKPAQPKNFMPSMLTAQARPRRERVDHDTQDFKNREVFAKWVPELRNGN